VIFKFSLVLLSLRTLNTVTHSSDTTAVLPRVFFAKGRQISKSLLQVCKNFLCFYVCQIPCSNLRVDRTLQASAQKPFTIRFRSNTLKFPASIHLLYLKSYGHLLFAFLFFVNVVACATSWSLVRGSPAECVFIYLCVI
jgi:hypothetical protein